MTLVPGFIVDRALHLSLLQAFEGRGSALLLYYCSSAPSTVYGIVYVLHKYLLMNKQMNEQICELHKTRNMISLF